MIHGDLTLGQFVLFNTLLLQLAWPLEALGWILNLAQRAIAVGQPQLRLARRACSRWPSRATPPSSPRGPLGVRFEDVQFGYGAGARGAARRRPGRRSRARSWRSAARPAPARRRCCSLLPRIYDPTAGRVVIGGVDAARRARSHELRAAVAIVTQRPVLFSAPLRANLLAARPDAARSEVLAACEAAGVERVRRRAAGRLRHADRRARRQPLGRPAPARRARARPGRERARAGARRPALGRRHRDRAPARREPAPRGRRPHRARSPRSGCRPSSSPTARSCSSTAGSPRRDGPRAARAPTARSRRCSGDELVAA